MSLVTSAATRIERTAQRDGPYLDWAKVAGNVRAEIIRADWTERQVRVAEFIVAATLDRGRQEVKGVKLDELGAVIGISKGNVSEVFAELVSCRFLQVIQSASQGTIYRVMPDSLRWVTSWRYDRAVLDGYLQALDVATGHCQGELIEPEPDLRAALAETSMETAARFSVKRAGTSGAQPVGESTKSTLMNLRNLESTKTKTESPSRDFTDGEKPVNDIVSPSNSNGNSQHVHNVPKLGTGVLEVGRRWERIDVPALNWTKDDYVVNKVNQKARLKAELLAGQTPLAQLFCGLFAQRPDTARELVGQAVRMDLPNQWLNEAVLEEYGLRKPKVAA